MCRVAHLCFCVPVVGGQRCHRLSRVASHPVTLLSCLSTRVRGGEERKQGLASCPLMSTPRTSRTTSGGAALGQQGGEVSRWIAGWGGSWRGGHRPAEVPGEERQADTPPLCLPAHRSRLLKPAETCVSSSASAASSTGNSTRGGEAACPLPGPRLSAGHCPFPGPRHSLARPPSSSCASAASAPRAGSCFLPGRV